ncbi:uncharacterized protein LOC144166757 [Haemaphysalis longicornis]
MLSAGTLALQSLLRQDCPPESGPRPLLGCWYVVCLVMSTVYCGRLTAFSLATLEEPVYSLDVLVQRRPSTIVLVKNGSLPFEVLKRPAYDFLWRRRLVRVVRASTSVDDLLAKVQRRKFAWMAEAAFGGARIREQRLQGLAVARTSMAASRWCLALGKGSPLLPHFDRKILQLWSHGLIDRLKKAYFHGEPMPAPEPTRPLTLANCKASFWMWFLGLLLASAACVCERLLQVRRIKMPPHKASPHGKEMVHARRRRSRSARRNRSRSTQAHPQPTSLWHVQQPVWPSGQFPYSNTRRLMRSCDM